MSKYTKPMRKLAFVVQRFGEDVVGGSENLADLYSQKLSEAGKWQVDIFTTTAKNYRTWAHESEQGQQDLGGGRRVFRFSPIRQRNWLSFRLYRFLTYPLISFLGSFFPKSYILRRLECFWIYLQGPVCPDLLEELDRRKDVYEKIFFFTYLYWPTLWGVRRFPKKAVLIPTAHSEQAFYFKFVKESMSLASSFIAISQSEKDLLDEHLPGYSAKIKLAGVGVDGLKLSSLLEADNQRAPYILYMGRISKGKSVHQLIHWFTSNNSYTLEPLKLILVGEREHDFPLPDHPAITYEGKQGVHKRNEFLKNAICLVNPSSKESLSLVVVESLALGTPVLVNKRSSVLNSYCKNSPLAFGYHSENEFWCELQRIRELTNDGLRLQELQMQTKQWTEKMYSWKNVVKTIESTIN